MIIDYGWKPFKSCTRTQLLELCDILTEQRDRALAEVLLEVANSWEPP